MRLRSAAATVLTAALTAVAAPAWLAPTVAHAAECATGEQLNGAGSWSRSMLAIDSVGQLAAGGGVTVAVLSSGVQADQRQFTGRVLGGGDMVANGGTA